MERLLELINKDDKSPEDRIEFLEELFWADWSKLNDYSEEINRIFKFLRNTDFNEKEISLIQKLYNNPDGAYIEEFSYIILKLYRENRIKFFKALQLSPEESENLAYLFRNKRIFEDGDAEVSEILNSNGLTEEEASTTRAFFRVYENLCNT